MTIPLTGSGIVADKQVSISPTSLAFGSVAVGAERHTDLHRRRIPATSDLTVTKAAPPTAPFSAVNPIPEGQQLAPGESYPVTMTFAPTGVASYSGTYEITTDTGQGAMSVTVTGTGTPSTTGTRSPAGRRLDGERIGHHQRHQPLVTKLNTNKAGSAVYGTAVPSAGLSASFTAQLSGGTGGTGLTFCLLDATKSSATSVGGSGGGMGFSGLNGVSVVLSTYQQAGAPSSNFVGIATGGTGSTLTYAATTTSIGALRTGTHAVIVQQVGSQLDVTVDGTLVLSPTVTLPASVLPAFTGATGATTDNHVVSGVSITTNGKALTAPGGGWSYNGVATMSGGSSLLTPATASLAGAMIEPAAVSPANLEAGFTSVMTGGTGGNGLTLSLFDASSVSASAVGNHGNGLGATGLAGIYVILATFTGGKVASSVAIGTNPASGTSAPSCSTARRTCPACSARTRCG